MPRRVAGGAQEAGGRGAAARWDGPSTRGLLWASPGGTDPCAGPQPAVAVTLSPSRCSQCHEGAVGCSRERRPVPAWGARHSRWRRSPLGASGAPWWEPALLRDCSLMKGSLLSAFYQLHAAPAPRGMKNVEDKPCHGTAHRLAPLPPLVCVSLEG